MILSQIWCADTAWVKVFRTNPEFRILRLTFHRKSTSKYWIRKIIIASLFYFQFIKRHLTSLTWYFYLLKVLSFKFLKFGILEILNFHPWYCDTDDKRLHMSSLTKGFRFPIFGMKTCPKNFYNWFLKINNCQNYSEQLLGLTVHSKSPDNISFESKIVIIYIAPAYSRVRYRS